MPHICKFYHPGDKIQKTNIELYHMQIGTDDLEFLKKNKGWYPYEEHRPEYDIAMHTLEEDGFPALTLIDGIEFYVQNFKEAYLPMEMIVENKIKLINNESSDAIIAGFDYAVVKEYPPSHFSYDAFDQQNYTDDYNIAIGNHEITPTVYRTGYSTDGYGRDISMRYAFTAEQFIDLYKASQLHKQSMLETAYNRRQEVKRLFFEYQEIDTPSIENTKTAVETILAV